MSSVKTIEERFWQKVSKHDNESCWEWNAALMKGYGWFFFNNQDGPKFSHRVSALLSGLIDNINSELHVLHKCDNTKCCNPNHLFIGTNADNVADRVSKGRTKCGAKHGEFNGMHKLTSKDVKSVKNLYQLGNLSQSKLATMFNVQQPHISRIINEVRRSIS